MLAGLFLRDTPAEVEERTNWAEWFPAQNPTWAGVNVSPATSMQLLAVNGSVRMISDGISTLPVDVFRKNGGMSEEVRAPQWVQQPTVDLTFVEWCGQILVGLLLHGNCYLFVLRNGAGQIVEVIPLDPQKVTVQRVNGRKTYMIDGQPAPAGAEILHLKGMMLPGADVGLSPVEYARQTLGLGLATVQYGAQFFDGEGNMPGVIELPHPAQPAVMKNLAEQWRRRRSRAGKGLPGVLEAGATWKATGVTNEQAQFLSTRKFTAAEIAGQMFLLDPSDLGIPVEGTSLTYANLEQRNARRIQVAFLPWMIRVEMAVTALLPRPQFFKFNVAGYLRGDQKARYEAAAIGIQNQFLTPNEAREREDMGPLDGGDQVVKKDAATMQVSRAEPSDMVTMGAS